MFELHEFILVMSAELNVSLRTFKKDYMKGKGTLQKKIVTNVTLGWGGGFQDCI